MVFVHTMAWRTTVVIDKTKHYPRSPVPGLDSYFVGGFNYKGFSLGAVTATLLAAIAIGQFGIAISPDVKAVFFLLFLFAIGYGVRLLAVRRYG